MRHEYVFNDIKKIGVVLIGCGGTGSQMLTGLARMATALKSLNIGEMRITAYDDDMVSGANVGRQLFSPSDIGHYKSSVLINRINQYFGYNWKAVREKFNAGNISEKPEHTKIVISCVDTRKARKEIFDVLKNKSVYWLDLGNSNHSGQAVLGNADYSTSASRTKSRYGLLPTVADLFPEIIDETLPEDDAPSCSLAEALEKQDLMVNQVVSTHALELLWQLLRTGWIENQGFFFDSERFNLQPIAIDKQKRDRMLREARKYKQEQAKTAA